MGLFNRPKHVFPMPRSAFVLLLLSVVLSVLPHIARVPQWLLVGFAMILLWRVQVFRERSSFPHRWLRFSLVSFAFAGVVLHHGTIFGPEAGVGLLITAYLFKQLEMYTRRDAFLVVILSYFVLATEFLFSKSLFTSLYVMLVLIVITAALIALNQTDSRIAIWKPLAQAFKYLLQSIPLLLVLFFLFPRIGPIWNLNMNTSSASIGLSDRVSPGDIANLSRSEKLAFRAEFQGPVPSQAERYWRATVFDRFDGRTWYAQDLSNQTPLGSNVVSVKSDRRYQYRIYLEPTGQNWLMSMPYASLSGLRYSPTESLVMFSKDKIDTPISYSVESFPDFQYQEQWLNRADYQRFTQLPSDSNPLAIRFARELYRKANFDATQFSNLILRTFFESEFVYTLSPPKLSGDTIDEFLFSTQKGFCSHYAGAYVFLMRSLGIPARMVGGYQGGELHPIGRYLLIHQYDAHAWAEYWVKGKGWVRVDPTAAVAPHRIEQGPLSSSSDPSFLRDSPLSPDKLRNLPIFSRLRMMADYVDYLWFKNVVGYDKSAQFELFKELLGKVTPQRIAMLIGGVGASVLLVMFVMIALNHRSVKKLDQADLLYARFLRKLERKGVIRLSEEGPEQFAIRAAEKFPAQYENFRNISDLYSSLKYSEVCLGREFATKDQPNSGVNSDKLQLQLQQLEAAIKQLRFK